MKNILLIYATREGQTEAVATYISNHMREAGCTVDLINAGDKDALDKLDLARYDKIVCGASLHIGAIEKEMKQFLSTNAKAIEHLPRSFFLVLMASATKDPDMRQKVEDGILEGLHKQLPVPFENPQLIAGALKYSTYNLLTKWMMKAIAKKQGTDTDTSRDYEYTDWEKVREYAEKLAAA